eukprot:5822358-Karenia_brevis.AAC.1
MRIENERNTDHNGALPLFLSVLGEDLDLKTLFQKTKCGTDFTRYTWGDVSKTRMENRKIQGFVFEARPTNADYQDMDSAYDAESIYS